MAVNDIFELRWQTGMGGQISENVVHYRQLTAGASNISSYLAALLISAFSGSNGAALAGVLGSDVTFNGYICKRVHPTGGNSHFFLYTDTYGSGPSPSTASSLGGVLLAGYKQTSNNKYRVGRLFLPSAPQAWIAENEPTSDYVTAMVNLTTALQTTLVSGSYSWSNVIYSRKHATYYTGIEGVLNWYFSGKLGTQRRRLRPAL
jgi:hypothetical protein